MRVQLALLVVAFAIFLGACSGNGEPENQSAISKALPEGLPMMAPADPWAAARVEAVLGLFNFSDRGAEAVRRIRVHHVIGRPGWFGSTGHGGFVGIGQSIPSAIVHEISHSFWGALPIGVSPALQRPLATKTSSEIKTSLRADLEDFLQQPPDDFEPVRARLRLIPDLITGNYPGLYHLGEAEIVRLTGGNLALVPPILRKYYAPWLDHGPYRSWDEAIRWYLSLPDSDRRLANVFIDVRSLALEGFEAERDPNARIDSRKSILVVREEQQRLVDFAEQFHLYSKTIDSAAVSSDPRFWRSYLHDMANLDGRYPDLLSPQTHGAIKNALGFLRKVARTPQKKRESLLSRIIEGNPSFLDYVAAIDHRTLSRIVSLHDRTSNKVRASLAPNHLLYLDTATRIFGLSAGRADAFRSFVISLDETQLGEMNFILEVFQAVEHEEARALLISLDQTTMRILVERGPAYVRFLMEPEDLIAALGFRGDLNADQLAELAKVLNDYVSGTQSIDERFLQPIYRRVATLSKVSPTDALEIFTQSGLLLEPFLTKFPATAANLVRASPTAAAFGFLGANPVRLPPARAIYRLIQADPIASATLTVEYERMGREDIVRRALTFFAYDSQRLKSRPSLTTDLSKNCRYLDALVSLKGKNWLRDHLGALAAQIRQHPEAAPANLTESYIETVSACMSALDVRGSERISAAVEEAFG